jgi:uncharacterized protein
MRKSWQTVLIVALAMGLMLGCAGSAVDAGGGGTLLQDVARLGTTEDALAHTISVSGVGTATARPDLATITLGVEVIDKDVAEALSASTSRMTAVREAIGAFDIAPEDLQTVQYNVRVEQIYTDRGEPTGEYRYHVSNQLRVRLHDIAKVGPVLTAALDAGANSVGGISFQVDDTTELETQARELAIANAQAKAEQLAAGFGAEMVGLNRVAEVSVGAAPVARMDARAEAGIGGGGQVPVEAGEFSVTVQLSAVFDIK